MPPSGQRAGDIVLIDSTHFTTLFGGTDSLRNLWRNLATMEQSPANRRPYEPQAASAEIAAAPRRKFAASSGIGSNWPGRA